MNGLLTAKQIAEKLQVDIEVVYRYIADKKLKAFKLGGKSKHCHWRIMTEDLEQFITGQLAGSRQDSRSQNNNTGSSDLS